MRRVLAVAVLTLCAPPLPLRAAETVRFVAAGDTLVGALALPERPARAPVVVVLHGSERGRRENRFVDSLRTLLLPAGIGVFSFDKRGAGESQGRYQELPALADAARDALAARDSLAHHPRVDSGAIGVLGVSQGGWVAPLMAARSRGVAFVIAISAAGVSPAEQGEYQRESELREAGFTTREAAEANAVRRALYAYWRGDSTRAAADTAWARARAAGWFARACTADELFRPMAAATQVPPPARLPPDLVSQLTHATYDPRPTAERVRVPVLHVWGEADRHVPVASSLAALRAAYARAGNTDTTFRVFAHAGHFLQRVSGDAECLRCDPAPGFAWVSGYPAIVRDWLVGVLARRR